jgi:hypothetical protein
MEIPRLNGVIRALATGQPAFVPFSPAEIGAVPIGEGDLSQDLGFPRQYEHPSVASTIAEV